MDSLCPKAPDPAASCCRQSARESAVGSKWHRAGLSAQYDAAGGFSQRVRKRRFK